MKPDYLSANQKSWDKRVSPHVQSEFYDLKGFREGVNPLNTIEMELLGNISGTEIMHLQCHFGMDTLALARLGSYVTGVDFSPKAIAKARELADELNIHAQFICCDVYDTLKHTDKKFDIVFTSYGTIGWLPDLDKWASVISGLLKKGGRLILVDFHPVVWMFDNQFAKIAYSYFNRETIKEEVTGSYADRNTGIAETTYSWNHSFDEILSALLKTGLQLKSFREYDYSPYNCLEKLIQKGEREYQIEHLQGKIPMVYSVVAEKTK